MNYDELRDDRLCLDYSATGKLQNNHTRWLNQYPKPPFEYPQNRIALLLQFYVN